MIKLVCFNALGLRFGCHQLHSFLKPEQWKFKLVHYKILYSYRETRNWMWESLPAVSIWSEDYKGMEKPTSPFLGSLMPSIETRFNWFPKAGGVCKTWKFTHGQNPWIIEPSLFWCWNWLKYLWLIWRLLDFTELSKEFKGEIPNLIKPPVLLVTCGLDDWILTKVPENLPNSVSGVWRTTEGTQNETRGKPNGLSGATDHIVQGLNLFS